MTGLPVVRVENRATQAFPIKGSHVAIHLVVSTRFSSCPSSQESGFNSNIFRMAVLPKAVIGDSSQLRSCVSRSRIHGLERGIRGNELLTSPTYVYRSKEPQALSLYDEIRTGRPVQILVVSLTQRTVSINSTCNFERVSLTCVASLSVGIFTVYPQHRIYSPTYFKEQLERWTFQLRPSIQARGSANRNSRASAPTPWAGAGANDIC